MILKRTALILFLVPLVLLAPSPRPAGAQDRPSAAENPVLKTPLPPKVLGLLANEISGQVIFNNEVKLAGAPWLREESEFTDTFYETRHHLRPRPGLRDRDDADRPFQERRDLRIPGPGRALDAQARKQADRPA